MLVTFPHPVQRGGQRQGRGLGGFLPVLVGVQPSALPARSGKHGQDWSSRPKDLKIIGNRAALAARSRDARKSAGIFVSKGVAPGRIDRFGGGTRPAARYGYRVAGSEALVLRELNLAQRQSQLQISAHRLELKFRNGSKAPSARPGPW